jgi:predicted flap endonuclease-1-like 5' DNA nuclease
MTKQTAKETPKKTTKNSKNKVKQGKTLSASALEAINSKLTSTKKDLENQVEDLSAQVKKLGKKSGKKALKRLKELDESYQRRLLNLQAEFEEGMVTLSTVQDKLLERLPNVLAEKITSIESGIAKSVKSVTGTNKKPVAKPRAKAAIKTATIASINSIGPVMQKKLAEKGITTLADIANTPKSKIQTLKQFEKERGFNTWKEQAKALLAAT